LIFLHLFSTSFISFTTTFEFGNITHSLVVLGICGNLSQKFGIRANDVISFTLPFFHSTVIIVFILSQLNISSVLFATDVNESNEISSPTFHLHQIQSSHLNTKSHSISGIFSKAIVNLETS